MPLPNWLKPESKDTGAGRAWRSQLEVCATCALSAMTCAQLAPRGLEICKQEQLFLHTDVMLPVSFPIESTGGRCSTLWGLITGRTARSCPSQCAS